MKKNIVITGITKGIGRAIAKKFYDNRFHLIGCSSNSENVTSFLLDFPEADVSVVNVRNKEAVQKWTSQIAEKYTNIEVLVNNVGKFLPGQIQNEADGVLEELLETNLYSAYHTTRGILPSMLNVKTGTIFNICSTASITAYTNGGSYCISKFAMLGFSKVLREELKSTNIRVTSVLPGATLTDSWYGIDLPKNRFIQPEDLAEILFTTWSLPQTTVVEELLIRPILGDIG